MSIEIKDGELSESFMHKKDDYNFMECENEMVTPIISKVTLPLTFRATQRISIKTAKAPMMAATDIAASPKYPRRLSATPPILPESNTTKATPKAEPLLIPSTDGPANGLRKTVCICKPLTANPAPATIAVNT